MKEPPGKAAAPIARGDQGGKLKESEVPDATSSTRRVQADKPRRYVTERTKGFRKPEPGKRVTRPSRWGNPYLIGADGTAAECCAKFEADLVAGRLPFTVEDVRRELRGFHLGCTCKAEPCHASILLRIANGGG